MTIEQHTFANQSIVFSLFVKTFGCDPRTGYFSSLFWLFFSFGKKAFQHFYSYLITCTVWIYHARIGVLAAAVVVAVAYLFYFLFSFLLLLVFACFDLLSRSLCSIRSYFKLVIYNNMLCARTEAIHYDVCNKRSARSQHTKHSQEFEYVRDNTDIWIVALALVALGYISYNIRLFFFSSSRYIYIYARLVMYNVYI